MQSRRWSLLESFANIIIGFLISVGSNAVILPAFGYQTSFTDNLLIGLCFTAVSLVRSYCLRRVFNGVVHERITE